LKKRIEDWPTRHDDIIADYDATVTVKEVLSSNIFTIDYPLPAKQNMENVKNG